MENLPFKKVEKEITGDPIHIGGYTVTPTARLKAWLLNATLDENGGGGAVIQMMPLSAHVCEDNGQEQDVPLNIRWKNFPPLWVQFILGAILGVLMGLWQSREN